MPENASYRRGALQQHDAAGVVPEEGENPDLVYEQAPRAYEVGYLDYISPFASKAWGDTGDGLAAVIPGLVVAGLFHGARRFRKRSQ